MDFAAGGTDILQSQAAGVEIDLLIRGGEVQAGSPIARTRTVPSGRAPSFFEPGTRVDCCSGAKERQPHGLLLRVRSRTPSAK